MHRNTLLYKLDQLSKELGLKLDRFSMHAPSIFYSISNNLTNAENHPISWMVCLFLFAFFWYNFSVEIFIKEKFLATVELKNINKIYDNNVQAVFDFNLKIKDREFIVLVGPSGCGKTTTLRMIAGLEEITSGQLLIDDEVMNDVAPKDRNIAMVFQSYALYPHMSVYDNMAFGLKLRKFSRDEIDRRVQSAAETLGLKPYLDRRPKALSGGQRQRVAGPGHRSGCESILMDDLFPTRR